MVPYYLLQTLSMWKALAEVAFAPFWWDKTEHGVGLPRRPRGGRAANAPRRPVGRPRAA